MYFIIGLILAVLMFFTLMGPVLLYLLDKDREEETPPLPPLKNYFEAIEYIAEDDPEMLKVIPAVSFIISFACFLAWPVFIVFAIIAGTLYLISVNKTLRKKSTEIFDNISKNLEDDAEDKDDKEKKDWFETY